MNQIKNLAGQTAIYGLSSIIPRFLNYLLVPIYTRIFIPGEYGIVTEMYAYVTFLIIILTYGMETGFFRFASEKGNLHKVYSTSLISLFTTSALFIGIVSINAQGIADIIGYADNKEYILWFGWILGIDAFLAIPFAWLRHNNKPMHFSIIKIINVCVNICFNIFFLVICPKILQTNPESGITAIYNQNIGVGYVFISNLIASAVSLILILPVIFKCRMEFDIKLFKKILKYSLPLLIAGLAGTVNEALDRILLKQLLPDSVDAMKQLGIYGANFKVAVIMTLFIQMFRYAAEPFFFKHAKEKDSKILFANVTKYFIIFGLFIFIAVNMYIDFVKYFIGEEYRMGLDIVPILLMANLFLGIFFNLSVWYKINNITKYGAYLAIFGAVITCTINIIFIPRFGYYASAWTHLICYVSMVIVSYFLGKKIYRVPYDLKRIFIYITIALLLFVISQLFREVTIGIRIIINTFMLIIFAIVVLILENKKLLRIVFSGKTEVENKK